MRSISENNYPFACFRRFAQAAFIFRESAFFCAAVMGLRFLLGAEVATTGSAIAGGFEALGERPRRFTGAPRASIARFNLSLSEIKRVRIWSVAIDAKRITFAAVGYYLPRVPMGELLGQRRVQRSSKG